MNTLEEVRTTIYTTFKALHDASFSNVTVNPPNYSLVDLEHLTGPFVTYSLDFSSGIEMYDTSAEAGIIKGKLRVSYLYSLGTGMNGSAGYSDMLWAGLCNKKISDITFHNLTILSVSPYPGIVGQMNVIPFMI